jgi:hypothetical protein
MDERSFRGKMVISGGSAGIFEIYRMSGGPWYGICEIFTGLNEILEGLGHICEWFLKTRDLTERIT